MSHILYAHDSKSMSHPAVDAPVVLEQQRAAYRLSVGMLEISSIWISSALKSRRSGDHQYEI